MKVEIKSRTLFQKLFGLKKEKHITGLNINDFTITGENKIIDCSEIYKKGIISIYKAIGIYQLKIKNYGK